MVIDPVAEREKERKRRKGKEGKRKRVKEGKSKKGRVRRRE